MNQLDETLKRLRELRQHRREEIHVEPMWVGCVRVSGAYWFQIGDAEPEICTIHGDRVMWTDGKTDLVSEMSTKYGNCFYGPLPVPSTEKEAA